MKKRIVIVGGGFGGVKAALELAKNNHFEITLISATAHFEYHGALYRSATGRSPLEVVIPLSDIFRKHPEIKVVLGSLTKLDAKNKCITLETGEIWHYDRLLLAMGSVKNYFGIKGMQEHSQTMYTIGDTLVLRAKLIQLFQSKTSKPHIMVIGAGPSGVELSGELQSFAEIMACRSGHKPKKLKISLVEGADRILPTLSEKTSQKALRRLKKLGIKVMLKSKVMQCKAAEVCVDDTHLPADLIVWTAGNRPVDFYAAYPDVFTIGRGGKVTVNEYLQSNDRSVYVLGDNALTPHSGMAQTALHDAMFVAHNLIREANKEKMVSYRARRPIYVVPIGPKWAIVQLANKGVRTGRYGWLIRRKADLWIFENFEPYKKALSTWRKGNFFAKLP